MNLTFSKRNRMIKIVLNFLLVVASLGVYGQYTEYPLYPEGIKDNFIKYDEKESYVDEAVSPMSLSGKNRVYSFVSEPTYMLFPADKEQNKHIGLVIAPGGGLRNVWLDKEGIDIALYLSKKGINCLVLKYRVNHRDDNGKRRFDTGAYMNEVEKDAKQAVVTMRSLAGKMDFDPQKVGMVGFSAGGWLTEGITIRKKDEYGAKKSEWMPDFAGLIYHGNSERFVKKEDELKNLPPIFMAIARNDEKMPIENLMTYFTKVLLNVDKSELHMYNSGNHGFGLAYDSGFSVGLWKDSFYSWMLDVTGK